MNPSNTDGRCRRLVAAAALLVAAWLSAAPVLAQETTGTITGRVADQSGAVVPGATVTLKHLDTGRVTEAVSNENGLYLLSALQPGGYEATFALAGFQTVVVKGIELHVNDRLEVNGKLGVTALSETVEVSAASQFVQRTPAVQSLIGPTQVQELPLNNRSFALLATLVPGVSSDLGDEVNFGLTNTMSISINGGRRNAVNWLVDGVSNVDVGSNITLLSTPTLESIQEFKIITSSYAAEWPRSGGGVISIVTKGGTRRFSGTAYEFYRDEKLNANSFLRNLSTNPTAAAGPANLDYNNYGYTIGGPLLPSREKAFFFFSQEFRKITREAGVTATVPNPAWLTDPTNANYVAPADRDPNAVKLLAAFPAPNVGAQSYLNDSPAINDTRQEVVRVDVDVNQAWKLTGRYTHDLSQTREPGGLFFSTPVPNVGTTDTKVPGHVLGIEARTVKGQILNELKYQYSGNAINSTTPDGTVNTRDQYDLAIPELFPENNADRIPVIAIAGLSTFGATQGFRNQYFNHTIVDTVTWQRGSHSLKGGLLMAFERKNEYANAETQGRFAFGVGGGRSAFQNFLTGNRDGLCAAGCSYSESVTDLYNQLRFDRYEFFAQDTWRATTRLTLDYGIRYAVYPAVTDADDVLTNFDPARYDVANAPIFATSTGTLLVVGSGDPLNGIVVAGQNSPFGRGIYETDTNNLMPRFGASYDLTGDGLTILRGGYGLYYDQPLVGIFLQNAQVTPPFNVSSSVTNPPLGNPGAGITPTTRAPNALQATGTPFDTPRTQQWNLGVQRQLYRRGSIDIGYVGSRGDDLIRPVDLNQPQPADVVATGALNLARPYRGYAGITMRETSAINRYWGFLSSFRHEGGRAGTYSVAYTLSRNRTDATNDRDALDVPQNPLDFAAEYADARTDRRHIFNATYIYELPFYKTDPNAFLRWTLGGWQISGITTVSSGAPVPRLLIGTNTGRRGNRANLIGDPRGGEFDYPVWFDAAAFGIPADGEYGDSPRAPLRLPGRNQTDLALSKNFYFSSTGRIQFRADMINAFNHTQFTTVNADCSGAPAGAATCAYTNSPVGTITGVRAPREIQLSLKLYW